jgi:aryl-alcohol dehydrogenase-like predicted oxidoreductase
MERVDLLQLHNPITRERSARSVAAADVRDAVVPALARLVEQGKIGFFGITALGDTPAVLQTIDAGAIHTAQVCFNLLNPSAGHPLPPNFPAQDFERLLTHCVSKRVGVIVIRVLAGGALSGEEARHPVASPEVEPIASGPDYAVDARRARMLRALVDEGHVKDLVEASLRFAVSANTVSTVLLGYSSLQQLDYAAACVERGPLPAAALARLPALWAGLAQARA